MIKLTPIELNLVEVIGLILLGIACLVVVGLLLSLFINEIFFDKD